MLRCSVNGVQDPVLRHDLVRVYGVSCVSCRVIRSRCATCPSEVCRIWPC